MKGRSMLHNRNVLNSGILTVAALACALPYIYYTLTSNAPGKLTPNPGQYLANALLQESVPLAIVVFVSCLIGFSWSKQLRLGGFGMVQDLQKNWQAIVISGAVIGILVFLFGDLHFIKVAPGYYPKDFRFAIFIPFYAALVEEVFARFGVMTLFSKVVRNNHIANAIAAIFFAIGHVNLFQVAGVVYRLNYLTVASFVLNLAISLFFGYIYWKKGLLTAMGVHFIANLRYVLIAFFI